MDISGYVGLAIFILLILLKLFSFTRELLDKKALSKEEQEIIQNIIMQVVVCDKLPIPSRSILKIKKSKFAVKRYFCQSPLVRKVHRSDQSLFAEYGIRFHIISGNNDAIILGINAPYSLKDFLLKQNKQFISKIKFIIREEYEIMLIEDSKTSVKRKFEFILIDQLWRQIGF